MMELNIHDNFNDAVDLLWVLSSEIRLKILQLINGNKEYILKDLAPIIGCGVSNLSQHVKILEEAGLLEKIKIQDGSNSKILVPIYQEVFVKLTESE